MKTKTFNGELLAITTLLGILTGCASMATETLYSNPDLEQVEELNHVVIAKPSTIGFEKNKETLVARTYFPLLSGHLSKYDVECFRYDFDIESEISNDFKDFQEKIPHYARYLLVSQISMKKPEREYSDIIVEYRLFDLKSKELLLYTQFDSTLGVVSFDVTDSNLAIHDVPNGQIYSLNGPVTIKTQPQRDDDMMFIGEALLKGLKEIELRTGLTKF